MEGKTRNKIIVLLLSRVKFNDESVKYCLNYAHENRFKLKVLYIQEITNLKLMEGLLDMGLVTEGIRESFYKSCLQQCFEVAKSKLGIIKEKAEKKRVSCDVVIRSGNIFKEGLSFIKETGANIVILENSFWLTIFRLVSCSGISNFIKKSQSPVVIV